MSYGGVPELARELVTPGLGYHAPVAMDGDDNNDDIRSPTSVSHTRILGSSRKPGRVCRGAGMAPQTSWRSTALRLIRPRRGPPSQNVCSRTAPMPTQSSPQAALRAIVGSQHFSGTRERAASHSRGPEGAHPSGEVRSVRRRPGSSSRPSSPPILISCTCALCGDPSPASSLVVRSDQMGL